MATVGNHCNQDLEANGKYRKYKVVLTGGPCGGKTTGQARLCSFFEGLGWKVFCVPETATLLLSGGIKFGTLTGEEVVEFQENLLKAMIQLEQTFFRVAETCASDCLIICDRGTMDASAFVNDDDWESILKRNSMNSVEVRDNRYNQVIHMVSAANGAEAFYTVEDHAARSEGLDLALKLDKLAAQAWVGHPYFDVIDNSTDFETKIKRMIHIVCQRIDVETGDRLENDSKKFKYLVGTPLPDDAKFPHFEDFDVEHVYLTSNVPDTQVRLRKRGNKDHYTYTHTIRKPENRGQIIEVKTPITLREYYNYMNSKDDDHLTVFKKRRCFLHHNQYFQLDIYKEPCNKRCKDLVLLETYSTLDSAALCDRLPDFLSIKEEVTGQAKYSMFNLSKRAN